MDIFQVDQCHQPHSQKSLPPERRRNCVGQSFTQRGMPVLLFAMYFITGIEVPGRKFTR